MTPTTLSPTPLAYEKPIHPTEMPCVTTCTELPVDDTNKSTSETNILGQTQMTLGEI